MQTPQIKYNVNDNIVNLSSAGVGFLKLVLALMDVSLPQSSLKPLGRSRSRVPHPVCHI